MPFLVRILRKRFNFSRSPKTMFEILMFLRRLVLLPYELVTTPFRAANEGLTQSSRSRAWILGLPAVVAGVFGVSLLLIAKVGFQERLKSRYDNLREKTGTAIVEMREDLLQKQRLNATGENAELQEEIKELKDEISALRDEERIYLEKLMELDPKDQDYMFLLAQSYDGVDSSKQRSLLKQLAPDDKSVYYKAHRFMCRYYYGEAQKYRGQDQRLYLDKALVHADHCLVQRDDQTLVKQIKALILFKAERYNQAYELFLELFEQDPIFYQQLVRINSALGEGNEGRNRSILNNARKSFKAKLDNNRDDKITIWVNSWQHVINCYTMLEEYEAAVTELQSELSRQSDNARRKFLQEKMADVYTRWAGAGRDYKDAKPEERREFLDRLKTAYKYSSKNPALLGKLTWFINNDPELSEEALKIYDPYNDVEAPAVVLSELGAHALRINDFGKAIEYFDEARLKRPNDPLILNNLAYSYLVSEEKRNKQHALFLVDDAMRKMGQGPNAANSQYRTFLWHTRGTALMQLGKMEEAAASFEQALKDREDNTEIIESLIRCYEGRIPKLCEMYRELLSEIRAKSSEKTEG